MQRDPGRVVGVSGAPVTRGAVTAVCGAGVAPTCAARAGRCQEKNRCFLGSRGGTGRLRDPRGGMGSLRDPRPPPGPGADEVMSPPAVTSAVSGCRFGTGVHQKFFFQDLSR